MCAYGRTGGYKNGSSQMKGCLKGTWSSTLNSTTCKKKRVWNDVEQTVNSQQEAFAVVFCFVC